MGAPVTVIVCVWLDVSTPNVYLGQWRVCHSLSCSGCFWLDCCDGGSGGVHGGDLVQVLPVCERRGR